MFRGHSADRTIHGQDFAVHSPDLARTDGFSIQRLFYKEYLAGVHTQSELEEMGFRPSYNLALPVLAVQSGGLVVDEFTEISRSIEHCVEDARAFYTLSFLIRRMQPSWMNITTSRYKSRCLDYLHARSSAYYDRAGFLRSAGLRGQASRVARTGSDPGDGQR